MYRWTCHALPLDLSRVAVGLVTPPPRQRINLIGFFARPGPYSRRIYEILRPHPRAPRSGGGVRSAPAPFSRGSPTNTRPRLAARGETLRGCPGLSPAPQGPACVQPPAGERSDPPERLHPAGRAPPSGWPDRGQPVPRQRRAAAAPSPSPPPLRPAPARRAADLPPPQSATPQRKSPSPAFASRSASGSVSSVIGSSDGQGWELQH